jgi:hypothetical protein
MLWIITGPWKADNPHFAISRHVSAIGGALARNAKHLLAHRTDNVSFAPKRILKKVLGFGKPRTVNLNRERALSRGNLLQCLKESFSVTDSE